MMNKLTLMIYLVTSSLTKHLIKKWSKIFIPLSVLKFLSEVLPLCSQIVGLPNICQKICLIISVNCEERNAQYQHFLSFQIKEALNVSEKKILLENNLAHLLKKKFLKVFIIVWK